MNSSASLQTLSDAKKSLQYFQSNYDFEEQMSTNSNLKRDFIVTKNKGKIEYSDYEKQIKDENGLINLN